MIKEGIRLRDIAYARSGDKGIHANIGIIAYTYEGYKFIRDYLTPECIQEYFSPLDVKEVVRYELPNLGALNFIMKGILGKGGSRSLRVDSQGKTLGQVLLEMQIQIPESILDLCKKTS